MYNITLQYHRILPQMTINNQKMINGTRNNEKVNKTIFFREFTHSLTRMSSVVTDDCCVIDG